MTAAATSIPRPVCEEEVKTRRREDEKTRTKLLPACWPTCQTSTNAYKRKRPASERSGDEPKQVQASNRSTTTTTILLLCVPYVRIYTLGGRHRCHPDTKDAYRAVSHHHRPPVPSRSRSAHPTEADTSESVFDLPNPRADTGGFGPEHAERLRLPRGLHDREGLGLVVASVFDTLLETLLLFSRSGSNDPNGTSCIGVPSAAFHQSTVSAATNCI